MITISELKELSQARIKDAEVLLKESRYDGAVYLCGYAVEVALKAAICKTLKWDGFPSTNKEFENYKCLKIHNLDILRHLSGYEDKIKSEYLAEWSALIEWVPEARYELGNKTEEGAKLMIKSAKVILRAL